MEATTEKKGNKPSYDARLKYLDLLEKVMSGLISISFQRDHNGWARSLRTIYSIVTPFWTNIEKKKEIKQAIEILIIEITESKTIRVTERLRSYFDNELFRIQDDIFEYSKHILLPVEGTEETDLDIEQFWRDSDL